jgi:hypothetical protein
MESTGKPQPDIGLGQASTTLSVARRFSSAPNGKTVSFILEPFVSAYNPRKRKHAVLTPDNADAVLTNSFDVDSFLVRLANDPALATDRDALYAAMRDCVKDSEVSVDCPHQ